MKKYFIAYVLVMFGFHVQAAQENFIDDDYVIIDDRTDDEEMANDSVLGNIFTSMTQTANNAKTGIHNAAIVIDNAWNSQADLAKKHRSNMQKMEISTEQLTQQEAKKAHEICRDLNKIWSNRNILQYQTNHFPLSNDVLKKHNYKNTKRMNWAIIQEIQSKKFQYINPELFYTILTYFQKNPYASAIATSDDEWQVIETNEEKFQKAHKNDVSSVPRKDLKKISYLNPDYNVNTDLDDEDNVIISIKSSGDEYGHSDSDSDASQTTTFPVTP